MDALELEDYVLSFGFVEPYVIQKAYKELHNGHKRLARYEVICAYERLGYDTGELSHYSIAE